MRIVQCIQGSKEWHEARLGKPTSSQFHRILTPKTRVPSSSAGPYLCELVAERLLGLPVCDEATKWMERGTELQGPAAAWYAYQTDTEPQEVGFVLSDDGRVGCSPDRLVGKDGGLEMKVLGAKHHVEQMLELAGEDWRCQIQGTLLITERAWWDRLCWNPEIGNVLVRVERDEAFIAALADEVTAFCDRLDAAEARIREMMGEARRTA